MKKLVGFVLVAVLAGCKARDISERKAEETRADTLILKQETIYREPLTGVLRITELCDTITGQAKDFSQTFTQGKDEINLEVKNGQLVLGIKQLDSVKRQAVEKYRATHQDSQLVDRKTVTIEKTPRWAWYSLLGNVLTLLVVGFWVGRKIKLPFI